MSQDMGALMNYAKSFTGLTEEKEALLMEVGPQIIPELNAVTKAFYKNLVTIEETKSFIEGRLESLQATHEQWVSGLFSREYDEEFTRFMHHVGDVHVRVKLPVEFMSGGMTLINNELIQLVFRLFSGDQAKCVSVLSAVNSATGFALLIMQQSYQEGSLAEELERFLKISGMSKVLFSNLAEAYSE